MKLNKFDVSAPGHFSLFGEPAVQYGRKGIAAAINLRTSLSFTELPNLDSEGLISLEFPQINLFMNISVQQFVDFYDHCKCDGHRMRELLTDRIHTFVASHSHMCNTENQKAIVRAFFYMLASITLEEKLKMTSIYVLLSTKLMMDTDFICLTPATVCIAACFLHWSHLQKSNHFTFDNDDLKKICSYAAKCEETFNRSSLIGPTVCTYGSIVKYSVIDGNISIDQFIRTNISNISDIILLVDSKQTVNLDSVIQVQRMTELMNNLPRAINSIFDKIEFATDMAFEAFRVLSISDYGGNTNIEKGLSVMSEHNILCTAIDMCRRLLQLLNMTHYHLDKICEIGRSCELYGKSITNFGNGRYAYIWCPPYGDVHRRITLVSNALNGCHVTKINFASSGVRID